MPPHLSSHSPRRERCAPPPEWARPQPAEPLRHHGTSGSACLMKKKASTIFCFNDHHVKEKKNAKKNSEWQLISVGDRSHRFVKKKIYAKNRKTERSNVSYVYPTYFFVFALLHPPASPCLLMLTPNETFPCTYRKPKSFVRIDYQVHGSFFCVSVGVLRWAIFIVDGTYQVSYIQKPIYSSVFTITGDHSK